MSEIIEKSKFLLCEKFDNTTNFFKAKPVEKTIEKIFKLLKKIKKKFNINIFLETNISIK